MTLVFTNRLCSHHRTRATTTLTLLPNLTCDAFERGPIFRATDDFNMKYQIKAQCYVNTQRFGSPIYQRMAEYYGPQYDIQFGYNHQGYGAVTNNVQGLGNKCHYLHDHPLYTYLKYCMN